MSAFLVSALATSYPIPAWKRHGYVSAISWLSGESASHWHKVVALQIASACQLLEEHTGLLSVTVADTTPAAMFTLPLSDSDTRRF